MACNHFANIKPQQLRKVLPNLNIGQCESCQEKNSWLCLNCYSQGCGRYQLGHAEKHSLTKKHAIAISTDSYDVWCYLCDDSLSNLAETFESESKKDRALEMIDDIKTVLMNFKAKSNKKKGRDEKILNKPPVEIKKIVQEKKTLKPEARKVDNDEEEINQNEEETKEPPREVEKPRITVRGLNNLGNTCFFNSALQCLNATVPLAEYYLNSIEEKELGGINMIFAQTLNEMRFGRGPYNPRLLHSSITKRFAQFRGYGQQDSHELLRSLLDALSTEFTKFHHDPNNIVEQTFGNKLMSTVRCLNCQTVSRTFDPILDLSLEIPLKKVPISDDVNNEFTLIPPEQLPEIFRDQQLYEPVVGHYHDPDTLLGCLEDFMCREDLKDNKNLYKCDECKRETQATRTFLLYGAPKVLVLHLKRFSHKGRGFQKIGTHIRFGFDLDIHKFVIKPGENTRYSLFGVVVHSGSMLGGHYIAFVKHNNAWYHCSDTHVSQVSETQIVKAEAYILFYKQNSE
ncbi:unnamed protein product [Blepharisma stoltei]|uniref:Ubiquitin carboxyl-terminal hydrolase n=1 Tax=Blepharisma stoltei TaxID=1481888 RepID=A0AAU9IGB7_9CILI|nr:unnamed protein product [Blepharisma stoltei]